MFSVAVIEDELQERQKLYSFLTDYSKHTGEKLAVSLFSNGADFLAFPGSFDLALIDIMLGQENANGLEIAQHWRNKIPDALLIFVTNMTQYALQSYTVDALNYIVKPVEYSLFAQKMDRAVKILHLQKKKKICVNTKSGLECLDSEEIYYIETYGRGLKIHTQNGTIYCTETLKTMEEHLPKECFFRCHKAILVNLLHVSRIHKGSVLVEGEEVPVSRHRKKEFMDALVNCFGGSVS